MRPLVVGDELVARAKDYFSGKVVAVVPEAHPECQLVVLLSNGCITSRRIDGRILATEESSGDLLLKPRTVTVYLLAVLWSNGDARVYSYATAEKRNQSAEDVARNDTVLRKWEETFTIPE